MLSKTQGESRWFEDGLQIRMRLCSFHHIFEQIIYVNADFMTEERFLEVKTNFCKLFM